MNIPANTMRLNPGEDRARVAEAINKRIASNRQDGRYGHYHWPRDAAEWWHNVDAWWDALLRLISYSADLHKPRDPLKCLDPLAVELERMRAARDPALEEVFSHTWAAAPDHASILGRKGWDVLCDLCSEAGVLHEEAL